VIRSETLCFYVSCLCLYAPCPVLCARVFSCSSSIFALVCLHCFRKPPLCQQGVTIQICAKADARARTHIHTHTHTQTSHINGVKSHTHTNAHILTFAHLCVCFFVIKPILGNRYVRSRGFIVSEPRETHPRSEIADVPTSPCPPLDNLGSLDPHPLP